MMRCCLLSFLLLPLIGRAVACAADFRFAHENVLGTSLELVITARSADEAAKVEAAALAEIDRLNAIFSHYRSDSELIRWLATPVGKSVELSPELVAVLHLAEKMRRETLGAFDVRAGQVIALWRAADKQRQAPGDAQRRELALALRRPPYVMEGNRATRWDSHDINLDAIAKGFILDAVCAMVSARFESVEAFTIDLGGDLRKLGERPMWIEIDDPFNAGENAEKLQSWTAHGELAMATSGNYRRRLPLAGKAVNHIFDPRTCLPVDHVASATVIAPDAATADAMATAVSVMPVVEAIAWVESRPGCECLLVTADGRTASTSGWPGQQRRSTERLVVETSGGELRPGLHVWFTLPKPQEGPYRRPYVAVWLEDADGFPVKTAVLWLQTSLPGPRWHRDLTRWYRSDRVRQIAEQTEMIGVVSGATRGPGEYEAHFDGTDNAGDPLPAGKYTLCLEAAREHGSYQSIRKGFQWSDEPIARTELKRGMEIERASFQFVPRVRH